jgi:hypothetical protein
MPWDRFQHQRSSAWPAMSSKGRESFPPLLRRPPRQTRYPTSRPPASMRINVLKALHEQQVVLWPPLRPGRISNVMAPAISPTPPRPTRPPPLLYALCARRRRLPRRLTRNAAAGRRGKGCVAGPASVARAARHVSAPMFHVSDTSPFLKFHEISGNIAMFPKPNRGTYRSLFKTQCQSGSERLSRRRRCADKQGCAQELGIGWHSERQLPAQQEL